MIHDDVLKACDGLDGVNDGVLEDPTAAPFDFSALACKGADARRALRRPRLIRQGDDLAAQPPGSTDPIFPGYLSQGPSWSGTRWAARSRSRRRRPPSPNIVYGDRRGVPRASTRPRNWIASSPRIRAP